MLNSSEQQSSLSVEQNNVFCPSSEPMLSAVIRVLLLSSFRPYSILTPNDNVGKVKNYQYYNS